MMGFSSIPQQHFGAVLCTALLSFSSLFHSSMAFAPPATFSPATATAVSSSLRVQQGITPINAQTFQKQGLFRTTKNHEQKRGRLNTRTMTTTTTTNRMQTNLYLSTNDVQMMAQGLFSTTSTIPLLSSFVLNSTLFLLLKSKLAKVLTPEGYAHSLALGTLLWHTLGWQGWSTCVLYLGLGSLVTKVKFQEKEKMGIAEGRGGRRGPENVWGSAATALLCAAASIQIHPQIAVLDSISSPTFLGITYNLYILGFVSSLATKLADTFASEIGKAYGKTTFLITTFERVEPGTEGAVSAEGTAAALFGGSLLPIYAYCIGLLPNGYVSIGIATFAAFMATNAESVIGAVLQGKKGFEWVTNEVVNFINTVIGAGIAISLGKALGLGF